MSSKKKAVKKVEAEVEETSTIEPLTIYCDGGYKQLWNAAGWGAFAHYEGQQYDLWGALPGGCDNNAAEVQAAAEAVKLADTIPNASEVTIISDSQYLLKNLTKGHCNEWQRNDWIKPDGTAYKNKEQWTNLITALDAYPRSAEINWQWVKGHSGDVGNDGADLNATRGAALADNGLRNMQFMNTTPIKDAQKKPKADYNRMFTLNRLYFLEGTETEVTSDGRHIYYLGERGKEDETLGKRISDITYSVVFLKEKDLAVEAVREHHDLLRNRDYPHEATSVVHIKLDSLFNPTNYRELKEYGSAHLRRRSKIDASVGINGQYVSETCRPARLAFHAMAELSHIEDILHQYVAGDEKLTVTDITDQLYEVEVTKGGKGKIKRKLRESSFDPNIRYAKVKVDYAHDGQLKETELKLGVGLNLPPRNPLISFAKREELKVCVVTWPESTHGFRHATVIEADGDVGIWCLSYANLHYIK